MVLLRSREAQPNRADQKPVLETPTSRVGLCEVPLTSSQAPFTTEAGLQPSRPPQAEAPGSTFLRLYL